MPSFSSPFILPPRLPSLFPPPSLRLPACLPVCPPLAAAVCSSARCHAGVTGEQATRRKPAPTGQPGNTLPTDQHTPTERQRAQLPSVEQDQGKNQPGLRCCVRKASGVFCIRPYRFFRTIRRTKGHSISSQIDSTPYVFILVVLADLEQVSCCTQRSKISQNVPVQLSWVVGAKAIQE